MKPLPDDVTRACASFAPSRMTMAACVLLWLCGCQGTPSTPPAADHVDRAPAMQAVEDALAQDDARQGGSVQAQGQDLLQARYDAIKRAFEDMETRGELPPDAFQAVLHPADELDAATLGIGECADPDRCAFDLSNCKSGSEYLGVGGGEVSDWTELHLTDAAFNTLRLQHVLREQGYPAATWQPALARYEQQVLALLRTQRPTNENFTSYTDLDMQLQTGLMEQLGAYRLQSEPGLLPPVMQAGCGAGEIGVNIATSPSGGVAEFIPVFHYRLCGVRGIDPEDTRACDHWREPIDGMLFDVAGDYRYRVQWPSGDVSRGKLSFTNVKEGQTVTLRRH